MTRMQQQQLIIISNEFQIIVIKQKVIQRIDFEIN